MAVERRKKDKQNSETAQKILAATFQCIAEKGSASVSLRDIALEAGVVLSQLNYYFVNREQLFAAVLRQIKQDYLISVHAEMSKYSSTKQKAEFLIAHNRELLVTNQALYRAFLDFFGLALWSPFFKVEMNDFLVEISRVLENSIADLESTTPTTPAASTLTLTNTILATTFGIAMQYLMNPDREELLDGFDLLLRIVQD